MALVSGFGLHEAGFSYHFSHHPEESRWEESMWRHGDTAGDVGQVRWYSCFCGVELADDANSKKSLKHCVFSIFLRLQAQETEILQAFAFVAVLKISLVLLSMPCIRGCKIAHSSKLALSRGFWVVVDQ